MGEDSIAASSLSPYYLTWSPIPQAEQAALAEEAHEQICPYSHATRGNVPVDFTVVGG